MKELEKCKNCITNPDGTVDCIMPEEKCCEKCIFIEDNSGDGIGGATEYCDNHNCPCHTPQEEKKDWEERWEQIKSEFIAVKKNEWWLSDEDFIKSFIEQIRQEGVEEGRKENEMNIMTLKSVIEGQKQLLSYLISKARADLIKELRDGIEKQSHDEQYTTLSWGEEIIQFRPVITLEKVLKLLEDKSKTNE